ncbi:MAG: thiamine diphosphokinase [Lachnospiraceae bacterium]|nr:thiamine diphosphokinase [Lachnospiraceae bacterium]
MKRCVIVGGADINRAEAVRERLREEDYMIYCDSGLRHREALSREPSLVVGDFDSHENPHLSVETIVLPRAKDDTDTVYAVKEALKRGFDEFLLVGVIGARLDHTIGNVSILLMLDSFGKKAVIVDDYSEMEIVSRGTSVIDGRASYFSLLAVDGAARGVTITGALFPLTDAAITPEYQYGISNEVLPGQSAAVNVKEGRLLLVKVFGESV